MNGVADTDLVLPDGYGQVLAQLKQVIRDARVQAVRAVNVELLHLYWTIGRSILDQQQQAGWGAKIIDRLATDLRHAYPKMRGLSRSNLEYMRRFAGAYPHFPIPQQRVGELPWGHVTVLLDKLTEPALRDWYAAQAAVNGWTRAVLVHQIGNRLHTRIGAAPSNLPATLANDSELAQQLTQDPLVLDFVDMAGKIGERQLEDALLGRIERFMLELGRGFSFTGRQVRIDVGGDQHVIDLLFFHIPTVRYIVIELKTEKFKPEHLGQLDFYVTAVDKQLRDQAKHAPTVGILLCPAKNNVVVEYAISRKTNPLAVSRYTFGELPAEEQATLPSAEDLRSALQTPAENETGTQPPG